MMDINLIISGLGLKKEDRECLSGCETIDDLFHRIDQLFFEWEKEIDDEKKKQEKQQFFTDDVENEIKANAKLCVSALIRHLYNKDVPSNVDISREEWERAWLALFKHRHFAYGFYRLFEELPAETVWEEGLQGDFLEKLNEIKANIAYEKQLYLSMAGYFAVFFGRFYDNELAIIMLCKYYPNLSFDEDEKEQIVSGLFSHIIFAGGRHDWGFAFNGINFITQWIGSLDKEIVLSLLKKYKVSQITRRDVYRHQINAIITNSKLDSEEQTRYKFLYLDSIMILNRIQPVIYNRLYDGYKYVVRKGDIDYLSCAEEEYPFLEREGGGEEYAWWIYDDTTSLYQRSLKVDKYVVLSIIYKAGSIVILYDSDGITNQSKNHITQPFDLMDWHLNQYETREFENQLDMLFSPRNHKRDTELKDKFLFSYIYLDHYHGAQNQHLSFDGSYFYDKEARTIRPQPEKQKRPDYFYSSFIYSISCIVGKNGAGKTSILNFMRSSFFDILEQIGKEPEHYKNNVLDLKWEGYGLGQQIKFLVVFKFEKKEYYLTNIDGVRCSGDCRDLVPYPAGMSLRLNDNSKIIYFSNKIDINEINQSIRNAGGKRRQPDGMETFDGPRSFDYSADTSYRNRLSSIYQMEYRGESSPGTDGQEENNESLLRYDNKDLFYQLAFLDAHNDAQLKYYMDDGFSKDNLSFCYEGAVWPDDIRELVSGNLIHILSHQKVEYLEHALHDPTARIVHFSSGQYSKFDFLSKLYWCLGGYDRYHEAFEKHIHQDSFSIQGNLQSGDTAILFIDEGELYYHPEWQRRYLDVLFYMIRKNVKNALLQIVITTNSPFIISDILDSDITYLPYKENKKRRTFGQNIHTLLKDNFYMESTIGEVSRRWIGGLLGLLRRGDGTEITKWLECFFKKGWNEEQTLHNLESVIGSIGEELYREELLERLYDCWSKNDPESQIKRLEREKEELERRIKELRGTDEGTD